MAEFVQRRPRVVAEEYDGTRESADRVMAAFRRPPESELDEFRSLLKWPESRIAEATAYKWYWWEPGTEVDRPAFIAGSVSPVDTGYVVQKPGLWFGYEEQGAGTGVTAYYEMPVGYVSTGWSLKPNWTDKATFDKNWEPVEAAST